MDPAFTDTPFYLYQPDPKLAGKKITMVPNPIFTFIYGTNKMFLCYENVAIHLTNVHINKSFNLEILTENNYFLQSGTHSFHT